MKHFISAIVRSFVVVLIAAQLLGIASAQEATSTTTASTNSSLELELRAAFPGENPGPNYWTLAAKVRQLTPSERNKIAVAAARELSLRTAAGDEITADTVDGLIYRSDKLDTPAEAELRRLYHRNAWNVSFLRDMDNLDLISDPDVLEPLIRMLACPGVHTAIPNESLQVLRHLTKRGWCDNFRDEERQLYVEWQTSGKRFWGF